MLQESEGEKEPSIATPVVAAWLFSSKAIMNARQTGLMKTALCAWTNSSHPETRPTS